MKQSHTKNTQELEQQVLQILQNELDSIPDEYHELIPSSSLPEDKLGWIIKAKKLGVFPGINLYYNLTGNIVAQISSILIDTYDSREDKLQKLVNYILDYQFLTIPKAIQELIPLNLTTEEKLAWLRKVKENEVGPFGMMTTPTKRPLNRGLGTGPFTGPGTAPGTGPGTAPWLENQSVNMYMNMPSESTSVQKKSIVKVEENEDSTIEEIDDLFNSELSQLNNELILQIEKKKENNDF